MSHQIDDGSFLLSGKIDEPGSIKTDLARAYKANLHL